MTFADNKERFSYTFFSGSPGLMRVKVHSFIPTIGKTIENKKDIKEVKEEARTIINNQLLRFKK